MGVEPLEMAEEQDQSGFSTPSTPKLTPATSTDISRTGTPGPSRLTPSFAAASGGNEELEAFRQQWRKEVQGRNAGAQQGADAIISTAEARGGVLSTNRSNNVPDGSAALLSPSHHPVRLAKIASSSREFGEDTALAADQLEAGTHRNVLTDEDDQEACGGPHSPTIAAGLMSTPEAAKAPASWRHQPPVSQADEVEDVPPSQKAVPPSQKAVPPDLAEARAKRAAEHARQDAQDLSTQDGQARIEQGIKLYAKAVTAEKRGHNSQAIEHYRRAFKLHDDVDRFFQRGVVLLSEDPHDHGVSQPADALLQLKEVSSAVRSAAKTSTSDADLFPDKATSAPPASRADAAPSGNAVGDFATFAQQRARRVPVERQKQASSVQPTLVSKTSLVSLTALLERLALAPPEEDAQNEEPTPALRARFSAADEEAPSHICSVPDEVLLHIIAHLAAPNGKRGARIPAVAPGEPPIKRGIGVVLAGADWASVEQLGRTSATLRRLTCSQGVWKDIVKATYFPPQLPEPVDHDALLDMHGGRHWRDVFIHQPRLRLNGVYIASCRYTRQGLNAENRWVNVVHLVEFYRSLRFLPDGRALSLLTTDVPADTVRRMEPALRSKGFAIGRWKLMPYGLADDEEQGRPPGPKVIIDDLKDKSMDKYCFRVILLLRQTSVGKHNRLDLLDYASVNLRTAEVSTLMNASHKLSFSFSAVRSYGI